MVKSESVKVTFAQFVRLYFIDLIRHYFFYAIPAGLIALFVSIWNENLGQQLAWYIVFSMPIISGFVTAWRRGYFRQSLH